MYHTTRLIYVVPNHPQVTCDRCLTEVTLENPAYHCLNCPDFDLCAKCAAKGIYCQNDAHDWMEFKVKPGQFSRTQVGATLTANGGKIHQPGATPYPSMFQSRSNQDTPQRVFASEHRFINTRNPREILIYTDGACSRNGQNNPQAGCCFVHRPSAFSQEGQLTHSGTIPFALEDSGPTGQVYKHTSNRAELRAVVAALQFRDWATDCNRSWRSIIITTDSEYVAVNATDCVQRWENKSWIAADGVSPIKNQDLWKLLLSEIRKLQQGGVSVSFWRVPREWNESRQIRQGRCHKAKHEGISKDITSRAGRLQVRALLISG